MKLIFPDKITIGTRNFKVIDDNKAGGDFNWGEGILRIGRLEGGDDLSRLNIIIHELFEMWAIALYLRYTRPDNDSEYEFHFNHRNFTNLCELATNSLRQFIK